MTILSFIPVETWPFNSLNQESYKIDVRNIPGEKILLLLPKPHNPIDTSKHLLRSYLNPLTSPEVRLLGVPNTDPHQVWLEDVGCLGQSLNRGWLVISQTPLNFERDKPTCLTIKTKSALPLIQEAHSIMMALPDLPELMCKYLLSLYGRYLGSVAGRPSKWGY